jgi:hypothetical protein
MAPPTAPRTVAEIVTHYAFIVEKLRPYVTVAFDEATADDYVQYVWEHVITSNVVGKFDPGAGSFRRYFERFVKWMYSSFMREHGALVEREAADETLDEAMDPTESIEERSDLNRVAEFVADNMHEDLGTYLKLSCEGYEDVEIGAGMLPSLKAKASTFHNIKHRMLSAVVAEFAAAA